MKHASFGLTVPDYEVILIFRKVSTTALGLGSVLMCLIARPPSAETFFPKCIMDDCFAIASIYNSCLCLPFIWMKWAFIKRTKNSKVLLFLNRGEEWCVKTTEVIKSKSVLKAAHEENKQNLEMWWRINIITLPCTDTLHLKKTQDRKIQKVVKYLMFYWQQNILAYIFFLMKWIIIKQTKVLTESIS